MPQYSPLAVIVPDMKLMRVVEKVRFDTGMEMGIHLGLFDDAVSVAQRLVKEGAKVLVSRGETTTMIRNCNLSAPILDIPITEFDLTPLLVQARQLTPRFAVVGFGAVVRAARAVIPMLGSEVEIFQIYSAKDIPDTLEEVLRRNFSVVVGNPQLVEMAEKKGMTGFALTSSEHVVLEVLMEARKLVEFSSRNQAWELRQRALLNMTKENLFLLDAEGAILNEDRRENAPAFSDHPELLGAVQANRSWSGVIHEEGQVYICKVTPVSSGEQNLGAIVLMENATPFTLEAQQENVRKGFVPRVAFNDVLHCSEVMSDFVKTAKQYSQSNAPVLIQGESGTGKEYIAQSIHGHSPRSLGPFVSVSCAAIPAELLESELFGYQGGAFTGARKNGKSGLFELAHTGTLFLDEIGELPLSLQAKLLRVLEERSFMHIGGDRLVHVDVRVIAASNKDLAEMARSKAFRDDLYFRLAVLRLNIPPLRERRDDIPLLFEHYLAQAGMQNALPRAYADKSVVELLKTYPFPGNVRELRSLAERAAISWPGEKIEPEMLAGLLDYADMAELAAPTAAPAPAPSAGLMQTEEIALIRKTLAECGNNRSQTARILGISPSTLWRKCRQWDIQPEDQRRL